MVDACNYPDCKCLVSTSTSEPEPLCPHGEDFLRVTVFDSMDKPVIDEYIRGDKISAEELEIGMSLINQGYTAEAAMAEVVRLRVKETSASPLTVNGLSSS